MIAHSES